MKMYVRHEYETGKRQLLVETGDGDTTVWFDQSTKEARALMRALARRTSAEEPDLGYLLRVFSECHMECGLIMTMTGVGT